MGFNFFKKKNKEINKPAEPVISEKPEILTKEEILSRILDGDFSNLIELRAETRGEIIYIPELEMSIKPLVLDVKERIVCLGFDMYIDAMKMHFTENSTGLGQDCETAYALALGTFAFSFMRGLKAVADNYVKCRITSEFAGHSHSWSVYSSDAVRTGYKGGARQASYYWELINEDIIKRLGNQKAVCVKIFNSAIGSKVIGECRINDILVPELGDKIAEITKKWEADGYVTEKQYFFIVQDDDTITNYPYEGEEGKEKLRSNVAEFLKNFNKVSSREDFDNIIEATSAVTGDKLFAEECLYFIPQICGEKFFDGAFIYSDELKFVYPDNTAITSYKCQISDYIPVADAVYDLLNSKILGEDTDRVYNCLAAVSSLFDAYEQVKEKVEVPKDLKVNYIHFNVPEDFEVR